MAKFQKGESGNPNGRPKGAKNRVPMQTAEFVVSFLEEDQDLAVKDWQKLNAKDRWMIRARLLEFAAPKLQRSEMSLDLTQMSDDDVDRLFDRTLARLTDNSGMQHDPLDL